MRFLEGSNAVTNFKTLIVENTPLILLFWFLFNPNKAGLFEDLKMSKNPKN